MSTHTEEIIDARVDPARAMAAVHAALAEEPVVAAKIAEPPSGHVDLPGGHVPDAGAPSVVVREAVVKELTGADEEEIVRARRISALRMTAAIIERGTVSLGDQPATPAALRNLLVGDREALLLAISAATYDEELVFDAYPCSNCGDRLDVRFRLDEIPVKRLATGAERTFEVGLRRGRKALVGLPTGADQEAIYGRSDADEATSAQINSALLTRCVKVLHGADGRATPVGANPDFARSLGVADRRTLLEAIGEAMPGPQYDKAAFTHEACGTEVLLPIGPGDLFPGM